MELLYIRVKSYKDLNNIDLNFSNCFRFTFNGSNNTLEIKETENFIAGFFSPVINNFTGIIGQNGTGKTSVLRYISDPSNYKIKLMTSPGLAPARLRKIMGNTNTEGNVNLFKLNEIYPSHLDVVGELIVKCDKYSSWYSGPFLKLFGLLLSTNKTEFYQYYFGNYFNEKDFHRRPLAKMTKDVIRQVLPEFMK